jgi:hypothetical protein
MAAMAMVVISTYRAAWDIGAPRCKILDVLSVAQPPMPLPGHRHRNPDRRGHIQTRRMGFHPKKMMHSSSLPPGTLRRDCPSHWTAPASSRWGHGCLAGAGSNPQARSATRRSLGTLSERREATVSAGDMATENSQEDGHRWPRHRMLWRMNIHHNGCPVNKEPFRRLGFPGPRASPGLNGQEPFIAPGKAWVR